MDDLWHHRRFAGIPNGILSSAILNLTRQNLLAIGRSSILLFRDWNII